ncbi:MAG: PEP-CTERM sorting domain-containing protein [Luteolibacter sp.]
MKLKRLTTPTAVIASLLAASSLSHAAMVLVSYEFTTDSTDNEYEADNPTAFQATTTAANVSATSFGGGGGSFNPLVLGGADVIHISEGNGLQDGTAANMDAAVAADQYFTFTVTADGGYSLDLQNLTFDINHGARGATDYAIRSSVDGFTANIVYASPGITGTSTGQDIDLSAVDFNSLSSVEFRIYLDNRINNNSGGASNVLDNVILNGDVNAVPEPSSLAMLLGGMGVLMFGRRRK